MCKWRWMWVHPYYMEVGRYLLPPGHDTAPPSSFVLVMSDRMISHCDRLVHFARAKANNSVLAAPSLCNDEVHERWQLARKGVCHVLSWPKGRKEVDAGEGYRERVLACDRGPPELTTHDKLGRVDCSREITLATFALPCLAAGLMR